MLTTANMTRTDALKILINTTDEWITGERELYERYYPDDGYYKTRILEATEALRIMEDWLKELKENADK